MWATLTIFHSEILKIQWRGGPQKPPAGYAVGIERFFCDPLPGPDLAPFVQKLTPASDKGGRRSIEMRQIWFTALLGLAFSTGCRTAATPEAPDTSSKDTILKPGEYTVYRPANRYDNGKKDPYVDTIQPILSKRCVTCHSCSSGPCQLNLTSYEGVIRGMSKDNPYATRLTEAVPRGRLSDHHPVEKWRELGFYPVIADTGDPERNKRESIMYLALESGKENLAQEDPFADPFGQETLRRLGKHQQDMNFQCPVNPKEYEEFKVKFPQAGMPFGCPAVEKHFVKTLQDWLEAGGKGPAPEAAEAMKEPQRTAHSGANPLEMVSRMETFLNQDSLARQAVARYIYEHAWIYNIHFSANPGEFYRIVRSRTRAPAKIDLIVTEFPDDAPEDVVSRIYYRLEKQDRVIEMKKHILWRVEPSTLDELEKIFFSTRWELQKMPPYTPNPFDWFEVIPVLARAEFVARYMHLMWQAIGRGAICHGRDPSAVGSDYAWYFVLDPASDPSVQDPRLGMKSYDAFYTHPRQVRMEASPAAVSPRVAEYNTAFENSLRALKPEGLCISDVWKGDFFYGLRHETSMEFFSARQYPLPGYSRYKLIIPYASHEIFYYHGSVHFRWWGSAIDGYTAFVSGVYTRTLGEDLFSSLHPDQKKRGEMRDFYTQGPAKGYYGIAADPSQGRPSRLPADLTYQDITLRLLEWVLGPPSQKMDRLNNWPIATLEKKVYPEISTIAQWESGIRTLTGKPAPYSRYVPNVVHIRLDQKHLYTLFVDRAHKNMKLPGKEEIDRDPGSDVVQAVAGFVGPFPYLFVDLGFKDSARFLTDLGKVSSRESWIAFAEHYKIPRNSDRFWPFVDWLHAWISDNMKEDGGIIDMRNYDLADEPL